MGKKLIDVVVAFKKEYGIQTYFIEYVVVIIILVASALITHKGWIEWVGVIAVFFTFCHASVADRLQEAEHRRMVINGEAKDPYAIDCYRKLPKFYLAKEICWTIYFVALGAWSALVGVVIFLIYPYWRKLYRKHHPLKR